MIVVLIRSDRGDRHHGIARLSCQLDEAVTLLPLQLVAGLKGFYRFIRPTGVKQKIIAARHESFDNGRLAGYATHRVGNGRVVGVGEKRFVTQAFNIPAVVVIQI